MMEEQEEEDPGLTQDPPILGQTNTDVKPSDFEGDPPSVEFVKNEEDPTILKSDIKTEENNDNSKVDEKSTSETTDINFMTDLPQAEDSGLAEVNLLQDINDLIIAEEPQETEEGDEKVKEADLAQLLVEYKSKNEKLEKDLSELEASAKLKESKLESQVEDLKRKLKLLEEDSNAKIAGLKKQFTAANRDKESMVIKYAMGEKEVIVQRRGKEAAEKKLQIALKEKEDSEVKIKNLIAGKTKLQSLVDSRYIDVANLKKDVDKWKEEVKVQEAKACLASSRLKTETESHRETKEQLEKTINHLAETRGEIDQTRKECADFMQRIKDGNRKDEEEKREQNAKLIIDAAAASELDSLRVKYKDLIEENNSLSTKAQKSEQERFDIESASARLKAALATQKEENVALLGQVAELESLKMRLQSAEDKCEAKNTEISRLKEDSVELKVDMDACRQKEAELLDFTRKLTDKNVGLQSEVASLESKASTLESEHAKLAVKNSELEALAGQTAVERDTEKKTRLSENDILVKKLAEKSRHAESLAQKVSDLENESSVLKRRHATSVKELTRELQNTKKKLEASSNAGGIVIHHSRSSSTVLEGDHENANFGGTASRNSNLISPNGLSRSSRTSSNTSLNHVGNQSTSSSNNRMVSLPSYNSYNETGGGALSNNTPSFGYETGLLVPESQVMVEKIIKLQRSIAKKQEKEDFMEEHIDTLQNELKKKSKIIQNYCLTQMESGSMTSERMDANKRKMSETGSGIMSSLYSSKSNDSGMTLELSLEINKKLQAVLEDTLLKNITLKENINTLGNEIAKIEHMSPKTL